MAEPVYLVRGTDPSLVAQAAHALTEQLVGGGDPSLMVEEFGGPGVEPFDVGAVIDACTTPAVPGRAAGGGGARHRPADRRVTPSGSSST